jgi:hypothetical protein
MKAVTIINKTKRSPTMKMARLKAIKSLGKKGC